MRLLHRMRETDSRALRLLCLLCVIVFFFTAPVLGTEQYPRPQGAVNDFAAVIPAETRRNMEMLARETLTKTDTAVVVATFKTIGDNEPDMYANELYEHWGIGKKGEDKGVLILLVMDQRRVRIETGYGVEGILPDGKVGSILDHSILPLLKQGEYGAGLSNGMKVVAQVIAADAGVTLEGEYTPAAPARPHAERPFSGIRSLVFVFLVILPLLYLISRFNRGRYYGRSSRGGYSGGLGGFGGSGGFSGGFGGFGGGLSGGGGASRGF